MLNVAVVGLGYFSQFHLSAWQNNPDARIVGVTDLDTGLAAKTAARLGVPAYADPAELIATTRPDIVDLIVPPAAQAEVLEPCLAPRRTVICQKPFGRSLAEAEAMTARAAETGTTLVIHENFRFQPWHRAIKRFLDDGKLGQVYTARFALRPGDGRGPRAYLDRQPTFQGMERFLVQETAVHFLDLFRWFFGEVTEIYADLRRLNPVIAGEDAGQLIMSHASGVQTIFDGNRLSDHVADNPRTTMGEMVIEGEAGALSLDGSGKLWFRPFGAADPEPIDIPEPIDQNSFGGGCVAALIGHVVAAHTRNGTLENEAADYLTVVRLCEAAYRSDAENRRISLP